MLRGMYKICVEAGSSIYQVSEQQRLAGLAAAIKELNGMIILEGEGPDNLAHRLARMTVPHIVPAQQGVDTYHQLLAAFELTLNRIERDLEEDGRTWVAGLRIWLNPVRSVGYCGGEWAVVCRD